MQDSHLYEYAVIRLVPKVEREEFINVGVGIFSKKTGFINMRYLLNKEKLSVICPDCDLEEIERNLDSFRRICIGQKNAGPIAQMDAASRFRWLTATRSSVIQTSLTHPGFSKDLEQTLNCLFEEMVL
ncbi:DUF3037 domain-containing protein [Zunongwangia endophytica]|uniref:DUF3037 domain-containing protein n=1 Tax=Zunongwangia endophytica TaxID=1808945 RepID=A0ABV8H7N0_9FLAO|nr:DUF3037 domain-containing protein [Zunongwangia endophytica]MDN3593855.1 DUF3037 domain-containing protein [Zunongwangia endophytica]